MAEVGQSRNDQEPAVSKSAAPSSQPERIRDFILAFQKEHGRAPLYKEIMSGLAIKSSNAVFRCINKLGMVLIYVDSKVRG